MYQSEPEVKIIADSVKEDGSNRITTFQLKYWRSIHSEFMTHREFSRNARSSRAVPIETICKEVYTSPWGPNHWTSNQKGMTGTEITDPEVIISLQKDWAKLAKTTVNKVRYLAKTYGVHKQDLNRLLEPFTCIHVVMTTTNLVHFLKLRDEAHAQPEMQDLAKKIRKEYEQSVPEVVKEGEWHLPYISKEEKEFIIPEKLVLISAARCARVSYKAFDGSTDINKDYELALRLVKDGHFSALEHPCQNVDESKYKVSNIKGWLQLRKTFAEEYTNGIRL